MSSRQILQRYYYGNIKVPETMESRKYGFAFAEDKVTLSWLLDYEFNWWSARFTFWHRYFGGISFSLLHPDWMKGYAKYAIVNEFRVFLPKPRIESGQYFPVLCSFTHCSHVVTEKELHEFQGTH